MTIKRQLNFAAHFYSEMKDTANVLSIYRDNSIEIRLVRWIVYIHLTLLRLFNLHGIPDPTTPGYIEIIERLRRLLAFWGSVFSELRGVLPPVATIFEDKLSLAEKVLIYLEQHNRFKVATQMMRFTAVQTVSEGALAESQALSHTSTFVRLCPVTI
ncbi:hypothetical protein HF325_005077 [Metschnikowia pulcherrima]|uniref:Uncharacterized protein n=1 Tax=Metschnikowia pulcherrima TaxID=27326 RepID=A0A8H7L9V0_9ASCO|nr:hypothetical protein HF325_005077 [Metschnikowia pulcherrima]